MSQDTKSSQNDSEMPSHVSQSKLPSTSMWASEWAHSFHFSPPGAIGTPMIVSAPSAENTGQTAAAIPLASIGQRHYSKELALSIWPRPLSLPSSPEAKARPEAGDEAVTALQLESVVQPEAAVQPEPAVQPETAVQPEAVIQPEAAVQSEATSSSGTRMPGTDRRISSLLPIRSAPHASPKRSSKRPASTPEQSSPAKHRKESPSNPIILVWGYLGPKSPLHPALQQSTEVIQTSDVFTMLSNLCGRNLKGVILANDTMYTEGPTQSILLPRIVEFARSAGGRVVCFYVRKTPHKNTSAFDSFFRRGWGLPWALGYQQEVEYSLDTTGVEGLPAKKITANFWCSARVLCGVRMIHDICIPTDQILDVAPFHEAKRKADEGLEPLPDREETAMALARVGEGFFGYVGFGPEEDLATEAILAMLGMELQEKPTELQGESQS